jgi:GMP synthase (glutamine-hydrolysing)
VGTFDLELTDEGQADPLLGTLPARFEAQLGHNDRAASLPDGVVHLASSRLCAYQALRIPGKPIWATQFHPELDRETNLDRYRRYRANYGVRVAENATAEDVFRESPESSGLLKDFLDLVFS